MTDTSYAPACSMQPETLFFGQFLVRSGVVTESQLQDALSFQEQHNQLLGQLAVSRGYLTEAQVLDATREQKRLDLPLGVIAMRKGYLNARQLDDLLFSQIIATVHIGEALVERGHLKASDLARMLNEFNMKEQERQQLIASRIRNLPNSTFISAGIESLHRAFLRFAHAPTTIVSTHGSCTAQFNWNFQVWMQLGTGTTIQMITGLNEKNALKIASRMAVSDEDVHCCQRCLGRNNLFFTIVKRYFQALLTNQNHVVVKSGMRKAGSDMSFPQTEEACIQLASPVGPIEARFFILPITPAENRDASRS